jgi:uncharacterized protein YjdB
MWGNNKYYKLIHYSAIMGSYTLVIGESAQLHVTISPNDASNKKFSWEVDDKVSIDQSTGKVTALKEGLSTIRAIAHNSTVVDEFHGYY